MSVVQGSVVQLETAEKFFRRTVSVFEEGDAGFSQSPECYTVAAHIAHVADSVDWFVEGAFGSGWDMDFAGLEAKVRKVTTLRDAMAWFDRAFANAKAVIGSSSEAALLEQIPNPGIMDGAPRMSIMSGITDHTAHHRGALAVYARLLGKVAPMPYS